MKLLAGMIWWDENPQWLSATVASLAKIGVDHLVAVDGAFAGFKDGRARSGPEQAEAIHMTADAIGIGCTIHRPKERWYGYEVEKRDHLFKLLAAEAEPFVDWCFIIDADEVITEGSPRIKDELDQCDADTVCAYPWYREDPMLTPALAQISRTQLAARHVYVDRQSRFFRMLANMRVEVSHDTYLGDRPDGTTVALRGNKLATDDLGHALPRLFEPDTKVRIEHRMNWRDLRRQIIKREWYAWRDENHIEAIPAARAGGE